MHAVLAGSALKFYLAGDGYLRSYRSGLRDEELTALEAYARFGDVLEQAYEKGSAVVG